MFGRRLCLFPWICHISRVVWWLYVAISPERSSYVLRGEAFRQLGQENEAIEDYTRALFIDPADVQAYLVRGDTNLKQGYYTEAATDFTKALDLCSTSIPGLYGRATAYLKLRR